MNSCVKYSYAYHSESKDEKNFFGKQCVKCFLSVYAEKYLKVIFTHHLMTCDLGEMTELCSMCKNFIVSKVASVQSSWDCIECYSNILFIKSQKEIVKQEEKSICKILE